MNENLIPDGSMLLLTSMRLSGNTEQPTVDDKDGVEGKLNVTSDDRKYYVATFREEDNPFGIERNRVISQVMDSQGNATWRSGNPALIKKFIGKTIPAAIITRSVEPYAVGDNTVDTYSCVVLKGESISTIFKSQGHELSDAVHTFDDDLDAQDDNNIVEEKTVTSDDVI